MSTRIGGQLLVVLALAFAFGGSSASAARGSLASTIAPTASRDAVVSGSFVGKADGAVVGVAVVAEKPAAEGQARTISMYVCNGSSLSVWLTGTTVGNEADLRSADGKFGAHVFVTALAASGKVGLPGGSGFRFTARRAVAPAGLFDLTIATNGTLQGASTSGARLSGRLGTQGRLGANRTVAVTASAGGQRVKLTAPARHLTPGAYRWIVLSDRKVYGANKRGPRLGGIGGFLRPTGGKQIRIKDAGSAGQKGYDDKKCRRLAGQFSKLNKQFEDAVSAGKETPASEAAGDKAQEILTELDDHCMIIF